LDIARAEVHGCNVADEHPELGFAHTANMQLVNWVSPITEDDQLGLDHHRGRAVCRRSVRGEHGTNFLGILFGAFFPVMNFEEGRQ
jgi:hypothetical protein